MINGAHGSGDDDVMLYDWQYDNCSVRRRRRQVASPVDSRR